MEQNNTGVTPLQTDWTYFNDKKNFIHTAVQDFDQEALKIICTGSDRSPVDFRDSDGQTAFFVAAKIGNLDAMRFLKEQGADMTIPNKGIKFSCLSTILICYEILVCIQMVKL